MQEKTTKWNTKMLLGRVHSLLHASHQTICGISVDDIKSYCIFFLVFVLWIERRPLSNAKWLKRHLCQSKRGAYSVCGVCHSVHCALCTPSIFLQTCPTAYGRVQFGNFVGSQIADWQPVEWFLLSRCIFMINIYTCKFFPAWIIAADKESFGHW